MKMKRYPHYKDSGVSWLGQVPAHWEIKRIKYVAHLNRSTLPETTDPDYEFYYIDIGSVTLGKISLPEAKIKFETAPSRARRTINNGDIIVSTVRTYLKAIAYVDLDQGDFVASTGFAVLSPKRIDRRYFAYLMMSEKVVDTVCSLSVGVSYPAVNASDIARIPIGYPVDILEQRTIVEYLDEQTAVLDTLITKKQQLIELLREERTAVINAAVTGQIDTRTEGLVRYGRYKDSGIEWLGPIPEHWDLRSLWSFAQLQRGHDLTHAQREPGNVPVYSSSGFSGFHNQTMAKGPGVVTGRYGTVGKVFYVEEDYWPMNTALYVRNFRGNHPRFVYYLLQLLPYEAFSGKSAVPGIDRNDLHRLKVACPPAEEQRDIANYLDRKNVQIDQSIAAVERQVSLLQEYRTALISAAVTGQIDVRQEEHS